MPDGKSNGSRHHVWELFQKIWVVFKGDAIFLLVLVCSEYLDILCSWSISCHVKLLDSFIFLLKISTQVVCVNEL